LGTGTSIGGAATAAGQLRHSHGLDHFSAVLREHEGMAVLDLGEFTQANVVYVTSLGHKLYSENLLHTHESVFGPGAEAAAQDNPERVRVFLEQALQFPPEHFDAVLVWNTLEHLAKPVLDVVMERLHRIMRPHGVLLACFHADVKEPAIPVFSFRIADGKSFLVQVRERRKPAQVFNNRTIEKLFEQFRSVKFFLTRDHLREVIVRR
jgi:SAM-dependent methyltransferase